MNDIKGIIKDVEKSSLVSNKVIKKAIKIIGQEEWNNIHDEESDICTTTGELIITLKDIAELEKENEDLKEQIKCYKAFESHCDEIEEDAKAIAKENEELKEQIEQMKCCGNC